MQVVICEWRMDYRRYDQHDRHASIALRAVMSHCFRS